MALSALVTELLNKFADTQPALRIPNKPLADSNPLLGDALNEALADAAGSSSAADAADSAADAAASAADAAQSAQDAQDAATYTAADAADWSGSAPATVQEALDRLAAALGPIA